MSIQFMFLVCAFYLGYLAECSLVGHTGKIILWSLSAALASLPICQLIYEAVRIL